MISNETNVICVCCLILLFYFSYQLIYGNPNIFEGMKVENVENIENPENDTSDEEESDDEE